jgi:hypothetical protein
VQREAMAMTKWDTEWDKAIADKRGVKLVKSAVNNWSRTR